MSGTIRSLCQTFDKLETEARQKNEKKIHKQDVADLKVAVANHKQHGRRDSVWMFGSSEETPGTTDDKAICLCNGRMQLKPLLTIDEIAVSHRVGQPRAVIDTNIMIYNNHSRISQNKIRSPKKKSDIVEIIIIKNVHLYLLDGNITDRL